MPQPPPVVLPILIEVTLKAILNKISCSPPTAQVDVPAKLNKRSIFPIPSGRTRPEWVTGEPCNCNASHVATKSSKDGHQYCHDWVWLVATVVAVAYSSKIQISCCISYLFNNVNQSLAKLVVRCFESKENAKEPSDFYLSLKAKIIQLKFSKCCLFLSQHI